MAAIPNDSPIETRLPDCDDNPVEVAEERGVSKTPDSRLAKDEVPVAPLPAEEVDAAKLLLNPPPNPVVAVVEDGAVGVELPTGDRPLRSVLGGRTFPADSAAKLRVGR